MAEKGSLTSKKKTSKVRTLSKTYFLPCIIHGACPKGKRILMHQDQATAASVEHVLCRVVNCSPCTCNATVVMGELESEAGNVVATYS
jgi:hypothetical protein